MPKKTKTKRKTSKAAAEPRAPVSRAVMVQAVAMADVEPDQEVADRLGVTAGDIRMWRHRARKDAGFARAVADKRCLIAMERRVEENLTAVAIARDVRRVIASGLALDRLGPFGYIALAKNFMTANIEADGLGIPIRKEEEESTKPAAPPSSATAPAEEETDDSEFRIVDGPEGDGEVRH